MHLLDVLGMRHGRINQHLKSGELAAVEAQAHGTHFDRRCIIGQEPAVSVSKARKVTSESLHRACRLGPALLRERLCLKTTSKVKSARRASASHAKAVRHNILKALISLSLCLRHDLSTVRCTCAWRDSEEMRTQRGSMPR
jgi:hypothetical protein